MKEQVLWLRGWGDPAAWGAPDPSRVFVLHGGE